jgi:two-component sensor histidine kinase
MGLYTPVLDSSLSYYQRIKYTIAWRLLFLFIVAFAILSAIFIGYHTKAAFIYFIVFCLSLFTLLYVKLSKNYIFIYQVFSVSASILVIYSLNTLDNTLHYSDLIWIVAIVLFSLVGLGIKWAIFFIGLHLLSIVYFYLWVLNSNIQKLTVLSFPEKLGLMIEVIFAIGIISYLLYEYLRLKEHSVNELKEANIELEKQNLLIATKNNENEILVKEVHHRVKNNLQIVVSLLRMQANELKNEEAQKSFEEAMGRIMTISLIHQKLYNEKSLALIDFKSYFEELINDIKALHKTETNMSISYDSNLESIGMKTVVPVGLILNELITNSIKHSKGDQLNIEIIFSHLENDSFKITYKDKNKWHTVGNNPGFGIELIRMLTDQLEGSIEKDDLQYEFTFKKINL